MSFSKSIMDDSIVFIDGNYLSVIAKHFFGNKLPAYDLNQFAINIAKEQDLWCNKVFYYTAPPFQSSKPTEEETERRRNYDKFVNKLMAIPNFIVREGRCQKLDDGFHQKGVDTLLTIDLMDVVLRGDIRNVILITCDTDFVPLLNKIRQEYKIKVILYYFSDFVRKSKFSMSNHILTACDKHIMIGKHHFDKSRLKSKSD